MTSGLDSQISSTFLVGDTGPLTGLAIEPQGSVFSSPSLQLHVYVTISSFKNQLQTSQDHSDSSWAWLDMPLIPVLRKQSQVDC